MFISPSQANLPSHPKLYVLKERISRFSAQKHRWGLKNKSEMGCFGKNNKVLPLGAENDQPPRAIRHKVKKRKGRKGKNLWNAFTKFFAGLLCACSTADAVFKNSVAPVPESMYGNIDSESDEEEEESTTPLPPPPPLKRGFQEVQFTMTPPVDEIEGIEEISGEGNSGEETSASDPAPPALLTVPITELPKPNECSESQDTRTTIEIIKDFRDSGLVADVVGESVKPNGLSYEIRIDAVRVRPKTAKGFRVPKPPRRLESLAFKAPVVKEEQEKLADKIKDKQEKAALQRQEIKETQQLKQKKKVGRHQMAIESVAAAGEQKKKEAAAKIACKAERVQSARLCSDQKRKNAAAAKRRHRERVRRCCDCQECPDVEYDKISTYNGSSTKSSRRGSVCSINGSDESSPLYYKTMECLVPVERNENHDDFFDGPVGGGQDN